MTTAILLVLGAASAQAVTDIRFESLGVQSELAHDLVAPVDTTSTVYISFDATVTASDVLDGFRFALAEKDGSSHDVLVRFQLAPCANPPAVGSEVVIGLSCRVYCDSAGNLHAASVERWFATWCDLPTPRFCGGVDQGHAAFPAVSPPEDFEFVILDESDQQSPFPTPEDAVMCGTGTGGGTSVGASAPGFADSGTLGIYADPSGTMCGASIEPFVPFTWYVVLHQAGITRCGISSASFGIRGLPPELALALLPHPESILSGGTFSTGFLIVWDDDNCGQGDTQTLVLYTLPGVVLGPVSDVVLSVENGDPPSIYGEHPWALSCPLVATRYLQGSQFVINPSPGHPCLTTVAADPKTWSAVKNLYR